MVQKSAWARDIAGVREERRAAQAGVINRIARGKGGLSTLPVESVGIPAEGVASATAGAE